MEIAAPQNVLKVFQASLLVQKPLEDCKKAHGSPSYGGECRVTRSLYQAATIHSSVLVLTQSVAEP